MANKYTETLFATKYRDDFSDSDHYHRILFNSGRQLQARELTQMQTIIQKEIERFGRNVFKEGASVVPGGMTVNNKYEFIKIDSTTNLPANTLPMVNDEFIGQTSGVRAVVIEVLAATATDPATLYVKYTNRASGTSGATPIRMSAGEDIVGTSSAVTLKVQTTNTSVNRAIGRGTRASMHEGTFFTQGHFVQADPQQIILSKYDSAPTENVGFLVTQDIISVDDTTNLYDNQGALPNLTAPGADRYRIRLTLTSESLVDSADTFVFYGKVRDGQLIETVTGTSDYNKIADFDAIRTREINGDFIKKPFIIKYEPHATDNTKLALDVSSGTAYVSGYRAHRPSSTIINVDKALTSTVINSEPVAANYGNYVVVDTINGLPDIDTFQLQDLNDATAYGGSVIGTARVKAVEEDAANWRYYLMDIKMNTGQNFRSVKSIGTSVSSYANLLLENGIAVIKDAANNSLLFRFPNTRVKSTTDVSVIVQRRLTATTDGSGNATFPSLGTGETFANSNQWVFSSTAGPSFVPTSVTGVGTQSASITGGPAGNTIEVIAHVQKDGILRQKTLTDTAISAVVTTPATGAPYIDLGKADIYSVDRVRTVDSDGDDLISDFLVDTGARDNFYDVGRLILKNNAKIPAGSIFIRYKYFAHSTNGHYFAANSYTGQVDYGNVPTHTFADKSSVQLFDVLDFRSRKDDTGTGFSAASARVNEVPVNTSLVTVDAEYYLPRYDKLVIGPDATISIISGTPSLTPQFAPTPSDALELYRIEMNAGTTDTEDMTMRNIEAKGFTMRDIQKLENRLERLEEETALSLLEVDVKNFAVFDSAGNDRTKSGFLVDNFSDHFSSDTQNTEFRSSIDPLDRIMRPTFNEENVRLIYDHALSTNAVLKGDNVYIDYTESVLINQPQVSQTINVNPFAVITHRGNLTLSPSSDEWKEVVYTAPRVISGGTRLNTNSAFMWNGWMNGWAGNNVNRLRRGQAVSSRAFRSGGGTTTQTNRVVADETIRQVIGERVVDIAIIPFMRSRKIYFKAEGLSPNVQMWPYFDGVPVNDWVKSESFQRFATVTEEYGNRTNNITQHPDTPSTLFTDASGTLAGSFFIPSTTSLRFRTGPRELKFLDITAQNEKDALSIAKTNFEANGIIETRQRDVLSTRVVTITGQQSFQQDPGRGDPLAQSFFIDKPDGVYATRVRLWFASKDATVPVSVELRPMVNGHPSSDIIIPGSIVYVPAGNVTTTSTATGSTDFVFEEPVYLAPYTEYAFVVKAESVNYNVYIAETEKFVLNSTEKKITKQPTLGSLFLSQNAATWEPAQTKDMMFELHYAQFDTAGATVVLENGPITTKLMGTNPLIFDSASTRLIVNQISHGLHAGDEVKIYGLDSGTAYGGGLVGTDILGARTVVDVDEDNFTITLGKSNPGTRFAFGGSNVSSTRNMLFETVVPFIEPLIPNNTALSAVGKFTSGKSLAGTETPYLKDAVDTDLEIRENNEFITPKIIANPDIQTTELGAGVKSATISINMSTLNPDVSPMIDMQRASMFLIHNHIDQQDSANAPLIAAQHNTPIFFADETNPVGGSHIGKHIVRPVTLTEQAIGLKVLIAANRPSVADFDVYYKVAQEGENFDDLNWVEIGKEDELPSDENPLIFRDYTYIVGGQGGLSTPFTKFTLKIVMKSLNSAKPPIFRDLRVIALAV